VTQNSRKFKALEVAYHRNGVCGEGFHVVRFTCSEAAGEFIAVRFEDAEGDNCRCAVFNVPMPAEGNIAFAMGNSWRGGHFIEDVDKAIAAYEAERDRAFKALTASP
jgi:hypothetical protein